MIHMVFMKFEEGYFGDAAFAEISDAFSALREALPEEILSVGLYRNCVSRDTNMDLLIRMELSGEASLGIYLRHPIHVAIGEVMNPHVVNRCSFDCESPEK